MELFKDTTPMHEAKVNVSNAMGDVIITLLDDLCVLQDFETNLKKLRGISLVELINKRPPLGLVSSSFPWHLSPEGYKYWEILNSQYRGMMMKIITDFGLYKFKLEE